MSTPNIDPTRSAANPSDSILMTLARAAMAPGAGEPTWPSLDLDDPAQREFGDYELLEEIGRGGMGVVYRARQRSLDRDVAVKFIAAGLADSFNVARFLGEARAAARLMHPNIVPVHEVGSIDGVHYFSMPLVKGRSLATVLDAGVMTPTAAVTLLLKLCDAIDYAHRLDLLHLDLKPANVLIDERGEPLVADFGLARHMDANGGVDAQEVSGTPSFMAPEQILIKQYRLTPATDLYALGAILYRCLGGVSPHGVGQPDELTQRAIAGRVRPLHEVTPGLPPDLVAVTMKCLELMPKDRYSSVAALADDLRRVRDGNAVTVRPLNPMQRLRRWAQRKPAEAAVWVVLFGGIVTTTNEMQKAWEAEATAERARLVAERERASAAIERDRARIAGEIGARLYTYDGEEGERAADLLGWLRDRLPGDAQRQADALSTFVASVDATSRSALDGLMFEITDVLGGDYRRDMVRALQAGSHPKRHLYAALLSWSDNHETAGPSTFTDSLQAAIAAHPDDPLTWHVAAVYCPGAQDEKRCLYPEAVENLTRLDPDNMHSWLHLALVSTDRKRAVAALHEAAKRDRIDDYFRAGMTAYVEAVAAAGVKPPALIAQPASVLAPGESPEASVALMETYHLPLPTWQPLIELCGVKVGMPAVSDPQLLSDCRKIGNAMVHSEGGIITQMIGVALVRNLARGTPEAEDAIGKRQLYQFLGTTPDTLTSEQRARYSSAAYLRDLSTVGELGAWQRRNRALGLPDQLPPGWQAEDPYSSLSSRERHDGMRAALHSARMDVQAGRFQYAIATLATIDGFMRKRTADSDKVQFLVLSGRAHIGLKRFNAAKKHLREAWDIAQTFGPGAISAIEAAEAAIELHTVLHQIEPAQGHDTKAQDYRHALAGLVSDRLD